MNWLKEDIGFTNWRFDFVKGYGVQPHRPAKLYPFQHQLCDTRETGLCGICPDSTWDMPGIWCLV